MVRSIVRALRHLPHHRGKSPPAAGPRGPNGRSRPSSARRCLQERAARLLARQHLLPPGRAARRHRSPSSNRRLPRTTRPGPFWSSRYLRPRTSETARRHRRTRTIQSPRRSSVAARATWNASFSTSLQENSHHIGHPDIVRELIDGKIEEYGIAGLRGRPARRTGLALAQRACVEGKPCTGRSVGDRSSEGSSTSTNTPHETPHGRFWNPTRAYPGRNHGRSGKFDCPSS